MGMSSSQARLLTLTARQHDVELRAQKLQADKLRMANDSDKVYNTYLEALSATKIQARVYNQWETDTFKDASLAMLEHGLLTSPTGDVAATPLFLQETGQNGSNRILVTQAIADQYGITATTAPWTGTMDDYFVANGLDITNSKTNPHRTVVGKHDAGGTYTDKTGTVASFTPVSNGVKNTFSRTLNTTPVANSSDGVVFNDFTNTVAKIDTSSTSIPDIMNVSSIDPKGTYKVTTKEGLQKLQTLGAIPAGVTIILGANINMSGITWTGISDFGGTFDGNGYVISNLTGSQGLFKTATGTIKNVGLEGLKITSGEDVGGICGTLTNGTVENCYVVGDINSTNHAGGILGTNSGGTVKNCNVNITMTVSSGCCYGGISGHNSGTIEGCNAAGTIEGSGTASWLGGLVGHNTGTTSIKDSITKVSVSHTNPTSSTCMASVLGYDGSGNLTIEDVTYNKNDTNPIVGNKSSESYGAGAFNSDITVPSIDTTNGSGDFATNILIAMVQSGTIDLLDDKAINDYKTKINQYALNLYGSGTSDDLFHIANVNKRVCDYINNSKNGTLTDDDQDFINALTNDINSGNTTSTTAATFQTRYADDKDSLKLAASTNATAYTDTKGEINIPQKATMIENVKAAYAKYNGGTLEEADTNVTNFISYYYDNGNNENYATIAYINELITKYATDNNVTTEFAQLMNAIKSSNGGASFSGIPKDAVDYASGRYTFNTVLGGTPSIDSKQTYTPNMVDDYDWNYDNPEVQKVLQKYMLQKTGITIIDDVAANSTNWLTNYINAGMAQFAYFDIDSAFVDNGDGTTTLDVTRMNVRGTSLASETSLQEVSDAEFVKRAEADYEAAMRKINRKETKIDTELQQLEAERTSIKTEQDSLKRVVDDNVNLSFKLFS